MFALLGSFVYRRRWFVLAAGVLFILVSAVFGTSVFASLKGGGFYDLSSESMRADSSIRTNLGRDETALVVLFTSPGSQKVEDPAYKEAVLSTLAKVQGKPGVASVASYYSTGANAMVSNDNLSTYAVVGLTGDEDAYKKTLEQIRPLLTSDSLQVRLGGTPAVTQEISEQVSKDLETAETMTFPILAVLLVLIFGSLVASSLPLGVGVVTILGAFLVLKIVSLFTDVSIFSINVITMLGLGLAIDYSLFMVSRFREEMKRQDGNVAQALGKTMQTAGRTVLFSGLTVCISLLSLLVFPQMFLKSMGMGGAAAVIVAMLTALTVLPAVLAILGKRVNSLSVWSLIRRNRPASATTSEGSGFWYQTSTFVMRRPTLVLAATLIPILIVGLPFLRVNLYIPDARSLPAGRESRVVSEMLENDFPRNETTPIQVVVNTDKDALDPASLSALYTYTRQIQALPGVTRVDSLVTLDPKIPEEAYSQIYSPAGLAANPQTQAAVAHFSKGNYTTVSVLYSADALSDEAKNLVQQVRGLSVPSGMHVLVGGYSAYLVDFLASLERSIPWALGIIVAVIFLLLFLMLGSVVVPLKAVMLNILSLSATFGALVWIFQDGHMANLLNFTPLGSVDGTQPVLIFAIAFGLSMDYEVFLLSRIKEHYDRTGDTTASVAAGVQKTGSIITSAAVLLVIVIGSFATGQVLFIKEIGVGLALAVLVDATLVRMLLVPATMRLLGRYNWWAPRPLAAIYNRLGLSEIEREEHPQPSHGSLAPRKPEEAEAAA